MTNREEAIRMAARQIAVFNGQVWIRLPQKTVDQYLTLATNIVATIERKQRAYNWNSRSAQDDYRDQQ